MESIGERYDQKFWTEQIEHSRHIEDINDPAHGKAGDNESGKSQSNTQNADDRADLSEGFCRGSVKFGLLFCICYERWAGYYQNTKQVYNSMHQVYPEVGMKEKIVPLAALESSQGLYKQKEWGIFWMPRKILLRAEKKRLNPNYLTKGNRDKIRILVDEARNL